MGVMYLALDAMGMIGRVLFMPIRAAAWLLRMITYLMVLALIAGVLYGLWSSDVRPW